jgi:hypothetical protein
MQEIIGFKFTGRWRKQVEGVMKQNARGGTHKNCFLNLITLS